MREASSLSSPGEGMLCSLTKRIMVVSPLPERIRGLLAAMTANCFDLFTLHDFNMDVCLAVKPELLICDALPIAQLADRDDRRAEWLSQALRAGIPAAVLLDEAQAASAWGKELAKAGAVILPWPLRPEESLERIDALLDKRNEMLAAIEDKIAFKDIRVDLRKMTVERNGERIDLTKTEYDLLLQFIRSDGSVQTRESLLDAVWGLQFYAGSNVVDVHIKSLRKKLGDSAIMPKYIVTVRGAGYRLADGPAFGTRS